MGSIFDLAEVEFKFTGKHTAVLETGVESIRIETLQVFAVLGTPGIRVIVELCHPLQETPRAYALLHHLSGVRLSMRPDHLMTQVGSPEPGTARLYLEPADLLPNTTLTQWIHTTASLVQ